MPFFPSYKIYVCERCSFSATVDGKPYGEKEFYQDLEKDIHKTLHTVESILIASGIDAPAMVMSLALLRLAVKSIILTIEEEPHEKGFLTKLFEKEVKSLTSLIDSHRPR